MLCDVSTTDCDVVLPRSSTVNTSRPSPADTLRPLPIPDTGDADEDTRIESSPSPANRDVAPAMDSTKI